MSESLANKIAAGEVIERIASVVKELVENSIDANSKVISVDLIDCGLKEIKVTDDGNGMDKEDALLSFQRHATSKIKKEDDLFFIQTLGFRGEALASIASVSKVDLKTSQGGLGTHIVIEGGKLITNEDSSAKKGTTMSVKDLFFNTPARLKYLKSNTTELSGVTSFIERLALSHPEISFTLTNNEKRIVFTSGSNDLLKTIHELFGYTVSSNMIEVSVSSDDYDIRGYICKPVVLKSNRNYMLTFVNDRMVKNADINSAINEGYRDFKPDIKYPVVVLKIDTDPTLVDVNIHPSKADIKISKIEELKKLIQDMINTLLRKTLLINDMKVNTNVSAPEIIDASKNVLTENTSDLIKSEEQMTFDYTKMSVEEESAHGFSEVQIKVEEQSEDKKINEDIKKLELHPVGIIMQTFIVAENEDGLYLIDQHAAHERINYEKVQKQMKDSENYKMKMLVPLTLEFSPSDYLKVEEHKSTLESIGIEYENFGVNTIIVKTHPTWLREGMEATLIKQIFDMLIEDSIKFDKMKFLKRVAQTTACKMSIRAHEVISLDQARELLKQLFECENPYNCAHGRPTIIHYSEYELDRMFRRIMN
jgi:DNA mismatch repair protein MutL